MTSRLLGSMIIVCVFLPGTGVAQDPPQPIPIGGGTLVHQSKNWDVGVIAGPGLAYPYGPGYGPYGYGPRVAPGWGYPSGLYAGVFAGYPWGYSARAGQNWSNGLSYYGPPVPVTGPIPGVFGNNDLVQQWHDVPSAGLPYGSVGIYISPRPWMLTTSMGPTIESVGRSATTPVADPTKPGGSLILSVKVPQPTAELFVDGVKTGQTGTDRIFAGPPLEIGKAFKYQVTARWIQGGAIREKTMIATGTPGAVVRVDFTQ